MNEWIKGLLGAGVLGTVYSFRTYIGIMLVLMVTTCSVKPEIVNYITASRDQAHQERMSELQAEQAALKLKADHELAVLQTQQAAEAQARADQLKADEAARRDQLRRERVQPAAATTTTRVNFTNGDYYIGTLQAGVRSGWGTYYFTTGNRYEGNWSNDRRNGRGTIYYADGTSRTGNWVNDTLLAN